MMRALVLVPALLVVAIAGCMTVGPDYKRPASELPEQWSGQAATEQISATWWKAYGDPVLDRMVDDALMHNLDLRRAIAVVEEARAALGIADADRYPSVTGKAAATRNRVSQESIITVPPGVSPKYTDYQASVNVSYEIDFWGKYRRATEAARAQLLQSDFARQDVLAGLVAGVASAYFTLQSLDDQLDITNRTIATREKFVELTTAQHDRGTVSELDVATAHAQLAIAKANLPELRRQIGQQEDQLSVLLGHNPDSVLRPRSVTSDSVAADAAPPVPVPAPGIPSSLLERRPDLREAEQNLVAANAQVGVAKANLFPTISLTASGGAASTALSSLFTGPARLWSFGGSALQPLLDSQRNLYELDLADAQKRQALLQYQKSVQSAFQEVSDALIARQEYAEVLIQEQDWVASQRTANTIALARYRVGYASYFDVIDSDRDLFSAELSLSGARLNTLLSVVQLYRALGGGWQSEQATAGNPPGH
jgi:outer membrane protein, multidrug efflux system